MNSAIEKKYGIFCVSGVSIKNEAFLLYQSDSIDKVSKFTVELLRVKDEISSLAPTYGLYIHTNQI